ncbi:DUF1800 domain-containing protein [Nocardioides euryhalodurans]|uniref:DUF1800 domain-containing protein n=1 Tax=Nocardioides euryhalodurans TaxID=2518370 RepID=A0A4P7GHT6_9ACTN|nr:DUF1800 domain-containing protein [Nocardioides euryhalodurans]QBR91247.1 DUF1800 domain-containing protein [Nocardioides euryhalodurans]
MTVAPPTTFEPSRRSVIGTAGVLGSAAAVASAVPAAAATYRPARYRGNPLLSASGRHLVGRFSYGITPALARQVQQHGGPAKWFEWQLSPGRIADRSADAVLAWWPGLAFEGLESWRRQISGVEPGWVLMGHYQRWLLLRRMRTNRQVHEVMTEFWEHLLHVPAVGDNQFVYRKRYGDTIRRHALGRFDEMLQATTVEPSMLLFLDQAVSTKAHPNENLARELLELHTVGRGNHTEDDVKNVARILTGWMVERSTWEPHYSKADHWTGPVRVLDFSHANAASDGRAVTTELLRYLAHHPATAARIARRLAVKFVSDDPPQALVDRLAATYLDHGTAIAPVLRALVASAEFRASVGQKVRDPGEDVVATYRVLGVSIRAPRTEQSAAHAVLWQMGRLGTLPMSWPRPDGQPISSAAWSSPSRLLNSMHLHLSVGSGWWPVQDARHRKPAAWVPRFPMRFDLLVDHLSQVLLHRRSTATLLQACCEAVEVTPRTRITRSHPVVAWKMNRLIVTILDSPDHYTR